VGHDTHAEYAPSCVASRFPHALFPEPLDRAPLKRRGHGSALIATEAFFVRQVVEVEENDEYDQQKSNEGHACKLHPLPSDGPISGYVWWS
jgi:hypothetical protein